MIKIPLLLVSREQNIRNRPEQVRPDPYTHTRGRDLGPSNKTRTRPVYQRVAETACSTTPWSESQTNIHEKTDPTTPADTPKKPQNTARH